MVNNVSLEILIEHADRDSTGKSNDICKIFEGNIETFCIGRA